MKVKSGPLYFHIRGIKHTRIGPLLEYGYYNNGFDSYCTFECSDSYDSYIYDYQIMLN